MNTPSRDLVRAATPGLSLAIPSIDGRTWIAVAAGILGAFMAILDIQITNSSLKEILGTLSATQEEGSWVATAYLVAEIIAIPLSGFFSRVFGVRAFLLGNMLLFLGFSTLCGSAWSLNSMIFFRLLQGFTGGALIPMAMTLVLTRVPPAKRPISLAMFGLTMTLAPTLGPTLGGYLTEIYGWSSIFYINWVPGLFALGGLAYGLDRQPKQLDLLLRVDWLGIFCMALGLGCLTVFLEEGNTNDWLDSSFIRLFAILAAAGTLGWILTVVYRDNTFVNLKLYARRNFLISSLISATAGMGLYGSSYIMSIFLAQIPGYNPMQIGEVIMWTGLPQILVMPLVSHLSNKVDNRVLCSIGLIFFGASCLMNTHMDANTGYYQLVLSQIVRALGQPLIVLTMSNFATVGIPLHDLASASSLFNMSRNLGGSVGIALLATLMTQREHFHSALVNEMLSRYSPETQTRLEQMTQAFLAQGSDAVTAAGQALKGLDMMVRRESYIMAYNDCFLIIGSILLGSILLVWLSGKVVAPSGPKTST